MTMTVASKPSRQRSTRDIVDALSREQQIKMLDMLTPRMNDQYVPHVPHPPQQLYLMLKAEEVFYGGAGGGGKSDAVLMAALQYVDVPGYNALILRRTYADLVLPGAIMDRAEKWLKDTDAKKKDSGKVWLFPSGARITFGYLQNKEDKHRYASAEFQYIAFDELTQFLEEDYTFLFSRLRGPSLTCVICRNQIIRGKNGWRHKSGTNVIKGSSQLCRKAFPDESMLEEYGPGHDGLRLFDVPLRMRSASNPGARGHAWVKRKFIDPITRDPNTIFVPAKLKDNPSVDEEKYNKSLDHMLVVDRERLKNGDWDVAEEGNMFQRHWWKGPVGRGVIPADAKYARFWDLAATEGGGDYTAGALLAFHEGVTWVVDVFRGQFSPFQAQNHVKRIAEEDDAMVGQGRVRIYIEQEPGSSGKALIDTYRRTVLAGHYVKPVLSSTSKELRATPLSSAVEAGNVFLVKGAWNVPLMDEAALFPEQSNHDDQVDAVGGAFLALAKSTGSRIVV